MIGRWAAPLATLAPLALLAALPAIAADVPACRADPLGGRSLYLRGSFNSWGAQAAQRFVWACDRWQLVTRLDGEHAFKLGDEGWSADADFGAPGGSPQAQRLVLRGAHIKRRFGGTYRFTVAMNEQGTDAQLNIETCPVAEGTGQGGAPLGETTLFLRGSINNWAALDDYAFQFSCDAYYLNLKATGRHEFKIADAAWSPAGTVGADGIPGAGNFTHTFDGEHTLRLAWAGGRPQLDVGPKSFADPRGVAVTDPVARSLRFDSRAAADKSPFGAVPAGTTMNFSLGAGAGVDRLTLLVERRQFEGNQEVLQYTEVARVPMVKAAAAGPDAGERWSAAYRFAEVAVYGYWFEAEIGGKLYAYQNNADAVFWTRENGSAGLGSVVDRPAALGTVRRFRQTVYARDFKVPDWAADTVYYYIFPDRFRNGNKANDPQPGVTRYHDATVEFHPNWLDKPWRPGDGSDAHHNNDFFGGDLAGIIDKLDYIRDLGANAIYMTPIFRASSNHKYDTADYRQVDPAFGSNEDFTRLTQEAARRGIRVITDASLNHTGADSIYFDRYDNFKSGGAFAGSKIRPDSPYASWYSFDPAQKDADKQFKGWVGVTDLPELDKASPGWRDFAYRGPDSITKLWLDRGASGWRMDVAPWVPDDFWREWRRAVKSHKPDAITIAEVWFDASKYFLGDMFDSTMNYIFRNTVLAYAAGGKAADLYRNLELLRESYPPQALHALMNLLSSHDQARSLHVLGGHDGGDAAAMASAKARYRLAVFFQMTYPGSPAIYYGDEVGVTGGDDPFNRSTYPWADRGGKPDEEMLAEFKKLTRLRHQHAVLRRGSLSAPLFADDHVVVLARRLGDAWAITATNNATTARQVSVALPAELTAAELSDALGGAPVKVDRGRASFEVPAQYGRVLLAR